MYILQISDLHISAESDLQLLERKIKLLEDKLSGVLSPQTEVVCCLLGDIIDQGNPSAYSCARNLIRQLFDWLTNLVGKDSCAVVMVPGNHDLCENRGVRNLDAFNGFCKELLEQDTVFSDDNSIYEVECFGYRFICASSVLHGEIDYGQMDFHALARCPSVSNTIMLTHHALISSDPDDKAPIRDGYRLQKYLEEHHVLALLHGHTHGCKRYTVGRDCQVIGVGPMFKEVPDVSNQCNLILVSGASIQAIWTLIYQGDREVWDQIPTFQRESENNYCGSSVFESYQRLLNDMDHGRSLENLKFQIHQSLVTFEQEIKEHFSDCLEEAVIWQSFKCPDNLSYTHGELMNGLNIHWDEFVISTLKENPSSKRAIVPLISKEMAFQGGDGKLVSFDVVQFGFSDSDCRNLHISVYLRALEVQNFLPLNLCETYLMAQKLANRFPSIEQVTICLFAFRAEVKKIYGRYKKARIDLASESQINKWLLTDSTELKRALLEKADMGDTVIETEWLIKLENSLKYFYERENQGQVLQQVTEVTKLLESFKQARQHCSTYSETQEQEDVYVQALKKLADMIC